MKTLFFPMNLGSGNRGCEGIIKGTDRILNLKDSQVVLYDKDLKECSLDKAFGVEKIGKIRILEEKERETASKSIFRKVISHLGGKIKFFGILPYRSLLQEINSEDVVFFTGGDLYCYAKFAKVNTWLSEELCKKGAKTVLWGASVSKEFLSQPIIKQLREFACITCRETFTLKNLKDAGVTENVKLYPDPAFVLEAEEISLPSCFQTAEVVGINISNFVNNDYSLNTVFGKNIIKLVEYIIKNTNSNILITPHVTWKKQDDRIISYNLYKLFEDTGRVFLLDIDNLNYCNIRYIISKCRFFVGARTHSVISAYTMKVPCLALGYSVKSRGIAHDLGLDEQLVINCKSLIDENEIVNRYILLEKNEEKIRKQLEKVIPQFVGKAYEAKTAVQNILA